MANNVIDSISYNSNNYIFTLPYGECSTAAETAAKTVQVTNFSLETGACVIVKFTVTNTASSPTLNVSGTGAKSIYYRNSAITASYLAANRIYLFVYDGTQWELIGDIDTNTTYSVATPSKNGLMPADDKYKSDCTNIAYGTCSTAAATAAKVVTINGNTKWTLAPGSMITVLFTYTNTASNPTLDVNSTGAKNVYYGSSQITTSNKGYAGTVNRPMTFMYDGTQYRFIGWGYDANTTYTNASLGQGYGTCTTAEATTAKAVTLSSYALTTGGIVSVKFTNAVPASATLNINSKGAKAIYHRGAAITAGIIEAGDTATFIYNGSYYHLISIDRDENTKYTTGMLGQTMGTCESATTDSTKIVTSAFNEWYPVPGGVITVMFENAFQKGPTTMNIDGKGAHSIYHNGSATLTDFQTNGKSIITFMFSGTGFHILAVNTWQNDKAPAYTYGTTLLTAGTSALATGTLHFVYE